MHPRLKTWLLRLALKGDKVKCPTCGKGAMAFLPAGSPPRPHSLCIYCGSRERTRMMALALSKRGLPKSGQRILHVAPDKSLRERLQGAPGVTYVAGDKMEPGYSYPPGTIYLDITEIKFPDDHFDVIICSHVLEHVPDDRKAMRELLRVLKPGGTAILQVPMSREATTDEDPGLTDREERIRRFGQFDHVRLYGKDYFDRLRQEGFKVTVQMPIEWLTRMEIFEYGVKYEEELVVGTK